MRKSPLDKIWIKASVAFLCICSVAFSGAAVQPVGAANLTASVQGAAKNHQLTKLAVNTKTLKLTKGNSQQLRLTATYSDKTTADVTSAAKWNSSDEDVATVDEGLVKAVDSGKGEITATYKGKKITVQVEVDMLTKLTVDQKKLTLRQGATQQLVVTATYSDKTTADVTAKTKWSTADRKIATVDKGIVTAVGSGKTNITGAYGNKTFTIPVEVDIVTRLTVDEKRLALRQGATQQLKVTAAYADKTTADVTAKTEWSTADRTVVTVDKGVVTAVGPGKSKIIGKYGNKTVTIPVEVDAVAKLTADQKKLTLRQGATQQLTVTATYSDKTTADVTAKMEWSTADRSIVTVDKGVVTAVGSGKSKIIGKYGSKMLTIPVEVDTISRLEVDPNVLLLATGASRQLTVTAIYSDDSKADVTEKAEWKSADEKIATVAKGKVSVVGTGKTKITATYAGKTASTNVESLAIAKLAVDPSKVTIKKGETKALTATATYSDNTTKDVTGEAEWVSANKSVATVSNGVITALEAGNTTIVTTFGGKVVTVAVEVK